jgi:hypothetical protein
MEARQGSARPVQALSAPNAGRFTKPDFVIVGAVKGRTPRTVPMTSTFVEALRATDTVRDGYVVLDRIALGRYKNARTSSSGY